MANMNQFIFKVLMVVAWIIFVALCVEAGALLVNFIYSLVKPEVVGHLYQKLDLSSMYARSPYVYLGMYSFILFIAVLKAVLFYVVIQLVTKFDLAKPFSAFAARKITLISYYALSIGLIGHIAREIAKNLSQQGFDTTQLGQFWGDSAAYLLMAAVIYIISAIFQRGIDLQQENDLTV